MKKFISILLVLVSVACVCAVGLAGCGDKDEFVEVYSVSYTVEEDTTTIYSTFTIEVDDDEYITKEEYSNFNGYKLPYYGSLSNITINRKKTNDPSNVKIGDIVLYFAYLEVPVKAKVKNLDIDFISVKAVSDREYIIKNISGTTKIISDFFKIEYFN